MSSAHPVYIYNTLDSIIFLGSDILFLQIDILYNDHWQPYLQPWIHGCGTGLPISYLPPNVIAISALPKFKGNKKLKMRLRWTDTRIEDSYVSNEIWGWVDTTQLK